MNYEIRRACPKDIKRIIKLLHQVNMVHYEIRPDLFKPLTTKYDEQELESILKDDNKPVFVYDDGEVRGYAFCQLTEVRDNLLLQDCKSLYIDDICVDEQARGRHVGKALYEYVCEFARQAGCHNITLNVWEGNEAALSFYRNMGMLIQKTTMEVILR
ncbi:MAG: GNAT family N-acetyltransferase [Bacteroidaceae bacterium]|nr:GNAT family N-acetyltransferase [Bacteroidaceae bacterium]